jgi:LPS export ABC transporter protein LptC
MTVWQRRARFLIVIGAAAFAVVVVLAFKRRVPPQAAVSVARSDPKAIVESTRALTVRDNREREEIRINYDKLLTYADGSSKFLGVKVVTERDGGRTFTITGREGEIRDRESNVSLTGNVEMTSSDGMTVRTEHATYAEGDGVVHAPGPVEFAKGRTTGSGVGLTYDKNHDMLTIGERVSVLMAPDRDGASALRIDAGTAEFDRGAKTIRFGRMLTAERDAETVAADAGTAHLSEDEQRMELLELRGNARVAPARKQSGDLQLMQGRDIDIRYAPDGQSIEHSKVMGDAIIQFAGDRGAAGRQITAAAIDIALAPDGRTPIALSATDGVQLSLPATTDTPARQISAQSMESQGEADKGLTRAHFAGGVQFRERGSEEERVARAAGLDVLLGAQTGSIDEARFAGTVRFEQADLHATAAAARYVIAGETLELTGREPGGSPPHLENDRISIDATRLDVVLDGPRVKATGAVKSVVRPARKDAARGSGKTQDSRFPSMLKQDHAVNVTSDGMDYDGTASRALYDGRAQLWQGDTTLKGNSISLDDKAGDLSAVSAATRTLLVQENKDKQKERVATTATARDFKYEESLRRATYTGDAHLSGPQGDMTAQKIELYLKESGDELDRLEAYDSTVLREQNRRKTTGERLTYFSADERYVVTGAPVSIIDECGRETTGRTLTFYKTTDRIIVDGNEQVRTQTKGKSNCP